MSLFTLHSQPHAAAYLSAMITSWNLISHHTWSPNLPCIADGSHSNESVQSHLMIRFRISITQPHTPSNGQQFEFICKTWAFNFNNNSIQISSNWKLKIENKLSLAQKWHWLIIDQINGSMLSLFIAPPRSPFGRNHKRYCTELRSIY